MCWVLHQRVCILCQLCYWTSAKLFTGSECQYIPNPVDMHRSVLQSTLWVILSTPARRVGRMKTWCLMIVVKNSAWFWSRAASRIAEEPAPCQQIEAPLSSWKTTTQVSIRRAAIVVCPCEFREPHVCRFTNLAEAFLPFAYFRKFKTHDGQSWCSRQSSAEYLTLLMAQQVYSRRGWRRSVQE